MPDYNETKSSLGERNEDPELKPDATPNPIEDINPANDERAIDVGESGQFAPGGRYNELGATSRAASTWTNRWTGRFPKKSRDQMEIIPEENLHFFSAMKSGRVFPTKFAAKKIRCIREMHAAVRSTGGKGLHSTESGRSVSNRFNSARLRGKFKRLNS